MFARLESTYGDIEESDINILKAKFNSCDLGINIDDNINIEVFFTKYEALRNEIGQQIKDQGVIGGMDSNGELSFGKMKSNVSQVLGKLPTYMSHVASASFNKQILYSDFKSALESHYRLMKQGQVEKAIAVINSKGHNGRAGGPICRNWKRNGSCSYGKIRVLFDSHFRLVFLVQYFLYEQSQLNYLLYCGMVRSRICPRVLKSV